MSLWTFAGAFITGVALNVWFAAVVRKASRDATGLAGIGLLLNINIPIVAFVAMLNVIAVTLAVSNVQELPLSSYLFLPTIAIVGGVLGFAVASSF